MYGCYAVAIAFYFFIHLTCLFVYIATYLCHRSTDSTRKPPLMQSNPFGKNLSLSIKRLFNTLMDLQGSSQSKMLCVSTFRLF